MNKDNASGKKILVAPMDWGLGHATRCIPLIEGLLNIKAEVIVAGYGRSLALLRNAYPHLKSLELPGYDVTYSRGRQQILTIAGQIPRLLKVMKQERKLTHQWVSDYQLDGIISDNRYGVWSEKIPSVFVGHQLSPALPSGMQWLRKAVSYSQMRWLNPFSEIWVPDFAGEVNLSGDLSHISNLPSNVRFLGPLSRFRLMEDIPPKWRYDQLDGFPDILVVLSGPEPQRSILEKMIYDQGLELEDEIWIVQGKTEQSLIRREKNITLITHLTSQELYLALTKAKVVISRSGYSSIMDYYSLGLKGVILIPTPGQTEQEYLGMKLSQNNWGYVYAQEKFNLQEALLNVDTVNFPNFPQNEENVNKVLGDFLDQM